jgi:cytochrome oxidase Cu insertion factor (SCO1/SenC/PrrC family)
LNPKTWRLVTGAKDVIYRVGREVFKADGTAADSPASFTHTRNVYLVDQAGRVRGIYDTGSATAMADLAKDIERLR